MAKGMTDDNIKLLKPIIEAFKQLRVDKHISLKVLVCGTGIAKSTISAFTNYKSDIQLLTLIKLMKFMKIDIFDIAIRITEYNPNQMREKIDEEVIRRQKESNNKDKIPQERVYDENK